MAAAEPIFGIQTLLRGYDSIFDSLVQSVPPGSFYDISVRDQRPVVLWTSKPNLFSFETDNPGVPVRITAQRKGRYHPNVDAGNMVPDSYLVPQNRHTTFPISLGLGLNRLTAQEDVPNGRVKVFEVLATPNATYIQSTAREIYRSASLVDLQKQFLFSAYSTRLPEQTIRFQDLLAEVQSLQILAAKLLVRSAVHYPATTLGVRNAIESFSLNTPVLLPQRESSLYRTEESRIQRTHENLAGQEAHVWFPNRAVTRWLTFSRLADSLRNLFEIIDIRDDQIRLRYQGVEQLHRFDFDAAGANFLSNLSLANCFDKIDMNYSMSLQTLIKICCWSYTFDLSIPESNPLGGSRNTFDDPTPFDSGFPFDADPIDPFTDGWVGWSLSGRFELDAPSSPLAELALDTSVQPALSYGGPACVYNGPYTQMLNQQRVDFDVLFPVAASGLWDAYTAGPIVQLGLQLPPGPFQAGTILPPFVLNPYPQYTVVQYEDANGMTNPAGAGTIAIQESAGGALTIVPGILGGFATLSLTPTRAGPAITWGLVDGLLTGISEAREVLPGPFTALDVGAIPNQSIGVLFFVPVQARDVYGNAVTDVGVNTKVAISGLGLSGIAVETTQTLTAGEALAALAAVYISDGTDGRNAGQVYGLDPDYPGRADFIGFAQAAALEGNPVVVQEAGLAIGFSGLTPGATLYGSLTIPGAYQTTPPGSDIVVLGTAQTATTVLINSLTPPSFDLVNGVGVVGIRIYAAGVGQLRFKLLPVQQDSNVLTVA